MYYVSPKIDVICIGVGAVLCLSEPDTTELEWGGFI